MRVKEFDIEFVLVVWIWIHTKAAKYDNNGNILSKSDVGDYSYGPDCERWYSHLTRSGKTERESVYAGTYERITQGGVTREFWYLDNGVVVIRQDGGDFKPYALFADEQGSILTVVDADGNRVFQASYDAWGRQTVATNTIGFTRGYTGHEMLPEFGIINMGGRLYDPVLGRFFSPDNYVQQPTNSQNFNRYSYCLNNPLKYTDPTGQMINLAPIALFFHNVASSMMNAGAQGKNIWKAGAISALASAATYGIGHAFGSVSGFGHELLRAGAHGLSTGVFNVLDGGNFGSGFVSGAASSGIGSFADGFKNISTGLKLLTSAVAGGLSSVGTGGDFLTGAINGLRIMALNHLIHTKDNILTYKVENGEISALMPEVYCTQQRVSYKTQFDTAFSELNVFTSTIDIIGKSLKRYSGNSTYSRAKFYWHGIGERGFYGNQYRQTYKLANIGSGIKKITGPIGTLFDIRDVYESYKLDQRGNDKNYYNTVKSIGKITGRAAAVEAGLLFGASIGVAFGGIGAVPVSIVCGAVFGFIFSDYGETLGELTVDNLYSK